MQSGSASFSQTKATIAAVGSVLLWCFSGVCYAKGARFIGPMVYLTLMTGTGVGTIIVAQTLRKRPIADLFRLPARVIIGGALGVVVYTLLLQSAFGMAHEKDLAQVNLLNYFWPIIMVLLAFVCLPDRPRTTLTLLGTAAGLCGIVVSHGVDAVAHSPHHFVPHIMALLGGFLWAAYCVLLRRWRAPEDKSGMAFHFMVCCISAAVVAGLRHEWSGFERIPSSALFWVLFGGIGPIGLAYYWWEIGVKVGNVHLNAALACFLPIGSTIAICLFFNKAASWRLIPGTAMIAVGVYLVRRASLKPTRGC